MIKRVCYLIAIVLFMAVVMIVLQVPPVVVITIIVLAVVIVGPMLPYWLWQSRKMRAWENFAYETELKYTERKSEKGTLSFLEGEYRKHHIEMNMKRSNLHDLLHELFFVDPETSRREDQTWYKELTTGTEYCVRIRNRRRISMYVYKERRLGKIGKMIGLVAQLPQQVGRDIQHVTGQDIPFDDPDCFDLRFKTRGNSESDIKAILDPYIRSRIVEIMGTGNFLITVPIENLDIVRYFQWGQLSDPRRLRLILDLVVDIAEKTEER